MPMPIKERNNIFKRVDAYMPKVPNVQQDFLSD
jgi:hypothetical protein